MENISALSHDSHMASKMLLVILTFKAFRKWATGTPSGPWSTMATEKGHPVNQLSSIRVITIEDKISAKWKRQSNSSDKIVIRRSNFIKVVVSFCLLL